MIDDILRKIRLHQDRAHEYPDNEDEIIEAIILAKDVFYKMTEIIKTIENY